MSTLPQYGGNPVNAYPLPLSSDGGTSRLFDIGAGASPQMLLLSEWLALYDPTFEIPAEACGAIVSNWGPYMVAYSFDEAQGNTGSEGSAFIAPVYLGAVPSGTFQDARPLILTNRLSVLRLRLGGLFGGRCTMSVVWTA